MNRLVQLERKRERWCENKEEVVEEISDYYSKLFTIENHGGSEKKLSGILKLI